MSKILSLIVLVSFVFLLGFGCQKETPPKTEVLNQELPVAPTVPTEKLVSPVEEEKFKILWKEIEDGHYLPVPFYYQKDVPKYGSYACGPTVLKMILEYKKQKGEVEEEIPSIPEMIDKIGVKSDVWSNSNVDNYFIEGFGITDVALKKLAQKLDFQDTIIFGKSFYPQFPASQAIDPEHKGQIVDSKEFKALINEEGWDTEKLHETIEKGVPVIVDVTVDLDPLYGPHESRSYAPFYTEDGNQHWELTFSKGHFMIVIGFQNWGEEKAKVILLDPLKKTEERDYISLYSQEAFERSWELMNNQGILIK